MNKKIVPMLLCFAILIMIIPTIAYADMGPKPSVVIEFEGLEDENYYVTLLSEEASTGPFSALNQTADNPEYQDSVKFDMKN